MANQGPLEERLAALEQRVAALERRNHHRQALLSADELAARQGIQPITDVDLDAMGTVWPEDESLGEFLAARRQWRAADAGRGLT